MPHLFHSNPSNVHTRAGHPSSQEEAWAQRVLPRGAPLYSRAGLLEAIWGQSLDRAEPLLTA